MQDDEEFSNHNLIELASVSYARPIFATPFLGGRD